MKTALSAVCQAVLGLAILHAPADLSAQSVDERPGSVSAALHLRQLDGVKRVLLIAAHPDDEDTSLLTALARGWGADVAYLALTRGEGGQNLIGPELGEGLGIVRTGELLSARELDGGRQFFTRAYDFGYSKSAEETLRHWPRDSLLADVVWVIRRFRPQVIVSMFGGTQQDGHGQHQAAGLIAKEAYEAAGDPRRFPEQLESGVTAWAPVKLYRRTWRDPDNASLTIQTGRMDPLLGRSHFQLAMESRSQHRSQDFGVARPPGPRVTRVALVASHAPGAEGGLFAGVDTTLAGAASEVPADARASTLRLIEAYRDRIHEATGGLRTLDPSASVPALMEAISILDELVAHVQPFPGASELGRLAVAKRRVARKAALAAAGVGLSVRASDNILVPGQAISVRAELWNGGPYRVTEPAVSLLAADGWKIADVTAEAATASGADGRSAIERRMDQMSRPAAEDVAPGVLAPGELRAWVFEVQVPEEAQTTEPYYLRSSRAGDLYRWPPGRLLHGLPGTPPVMRARARMALDLESHDAGLSAWNGAETSGAAGEPSLVTEREVRFRGVDKASGEYWRPVHVVPAISVGLDPGVLVWPAASSEPRTLRVDLRSYAPDERSGTVTLELPAGWDAEPASRPFTLDEADAAEFEFVVHAPERDAVAATDGLRIRAVATTDSGTRYDRHVALIDYPHIRPVPTLSEATSLVRRFPVSIAERRVGYLMGSGDDGPEALRQLGLEVMPIEPNALDREGLTRFEVVVLGVRTYETRPDLVAANDALLDWVEAGGVLVVQYNKYEFSDGDYAPFPLAIGRPAPRVTDETAPVTLIDPAAPPLEWPNRIGPDDFDGWVQERGLYFISEWDPAFVPLLAMADPGEEPLLGSLLVAASGSGAYVYTSLSFFRQWPAGVPGAYRLFANLISLDPVAWREYVSAR